MKATQTLTSMALVMSLACGGCSDAPDPSAGQSGNATFTVTLSRGCAGLLSQGCAIDRPLMAGVHETVRVVLRSSADASDPGLTFSSADPSVLRVIPAERDRSATRPSEYTVGVLAGAAGTTWFEVARASGARVDRVQVRVAEPASMDLVEDGDTHTLASDGRSATVRVGQQGSFTGYPRDASGQRLFANDRVVWTVPDASTARLEWGITIDPTRAADDHVFVRAVAPGTVAVTATAGATTRTLSVVVIP